MPNIVSDLKAETECRQRSVKNVSLFISENAVNDMIYHSESGNGNEIMGLLIGRMFSDDDGAYAIVKKVISSNLLSDATSVRFDTGSIEPLFDAIDGLDERDVVTGWYHSHPDMGCFMSEVDSRTHSGIFGEEGFAMVIDPVRQELVAFASVNGTMKETQFVIMED